MSKNKEASVKQYANLFFNPFAFGEGDIPTTARDTPTSTAVKHAAGLAVGYGGIGMLLRYLKKMKDEADVTTTDSKMRDYIEAKNPILSLDPSIRDTKTEQKEKGIGVQRTENDPTFMGKEGSSAIHPALAIAAALTAGYGGYRLADRKIDRDEQREIDDQTAKDENKIDQLLYQEYVRSRGLDKVAVERGSVGGIKAIEPSFSSEVSPGSPNYNPGVDKLTATTASIYGVIALGLMALSHKAARSYMDANDPSRQRMTALRSALSEKGKVRGAPKFADMSKFTGKAKSSPHKSSSVSLQRKSDTKNPATDAKAVDDSDPYSDLLAQE